MNDVYFLEYISKEMELVTENSYGQIICKGKCKNLCTTNYCCKICGPKSEQLCVRRTEYISTSFWRNLNRRTKDINIFYETCIEIWSRKHFALNSERKISLKRLILSVKKNCSSSTIWKYILDCTYLLKWGYEGFM